MKKERIMTLVDSFVDVNGDEHHFVIAAITEPFEEEEVIAYTDFGYLDIAKGVKIGFSICSPEDEFDEKLGKIIAIGRARKNAEYSLLATRPGYINTKLIEAFLEQEAEYFVNNPEYLIAGYKRIISRKKK